MSHVLADNVNCFNHVNHVSNNITVNPIDDDSKLLAWLSPLEPHVRHQDIRDQRVASVGDWLLETKEFRNWYNGSGEDESDHAALLCYGDPGVGKSYIRYGGPPVGGKEIPLLLTPHNCSSMVVDYLCDQAIEQDMAVACFYYDFASRTEQS